MSEWKKGAGRPTLEQLDALKKKKENKKNNSVIMMIAEMCHEANRVWCQINGDYSQPSWDSAPEWQKDSAIKGVLFHMANPDAGDTASHDSWMNQKLNEGWVYGEVKDAEKKTHPCIVPFEQLPWVQQKKDAIFRSLVHALK